MAQNAQTKQKTVTYVYGIVPADVETDADARGVGDPPAEVEVVRHGDIAALVSDISADEPLGRPEDLTAHAQLLDGASAEAPVLPMRFGAALSDRQAVADELLGPNHDEFSAALEQLEGQAQYVVKGRYEEQAILAEVLSENSDARQLRERIQGKPEEVSRDDRIALGEFVTKAVAAKRDADTRALLSALDPVSADVNMREPTHERDAIHLACLAETQKQAEIEDAVREFASEHEGRIDLRVLGPMAPYDFVTTQQPQE